MNPTWCLIIYLVVLLRCTLSKYIWYTICSKPQGSSSYDNFYYHNILLLPWGDELDISFSSFIARKFWDTENRLVATCKRMKVGVRDNENHLVSVGQKFRLLHKSTMKNRLKPLNLINWKTSSSVIPVEWYTLILKVFLNFRIHKTNKWFLIVF